MNFIEILKLCNPFSWIKSKHITDVEQDIPKKLNWFYAPSFVAFWSILYLSVVVSQINQLPTPLNRVDECTHPNSFIAERAEETLIKLTTIGPKVVGSIANEVTTVEFLQTVLAKIQAQASNYFEFEMEVQVASGSYVRWSLINIYQSIQNVVVKMSAKNCTSENYLLINSHYDTVPKSPGAADDGSMVVVMLEVMRVIAKCDGPLANPIIFLFNGAEENPLQASHAFITQHKWAKNCKALINLDAAGSGGRELLFQSGPGHPWLMKYYKQVPHPFATSVGEEIFQAGLIPSDTDFSIFRDYGNVPGLDMAYIFNGYVYHTKYDCAEIFPRGSLQHTGDNVLSLAKSIANAPEMDDTSIYAEGHTVYYDFLGWFIILYTQNSGVVINSVVCVVALLTIAASIFFMSADSGIVWYAIVLRYGTTFTVHIFSLALGVGLSVLVGVLMDGVLRSMTWFSNNYLIFGLFFFPMFFGMGILPALYLDQTKKDPLSLAFRIQLFMHSHCLTLILLTILLTALGIRSAFMCMMAVFYNTVAQIINLITKWHRKISWFFTTAMICQILPFLFYTSIANLAYNVIIPMMGRSGSKSNPDKFIAFIAVFMSIMCAGFIIPLFLFFRKTKTIIFCCFGVALLFIIIAVTPAGFPYMPKISAQRYDLIHVHRVLHGFHNNTRLNESGILVYPQDRRINIAHHIMANVGKKHLVSECCGNEMFCGMPFLTHRYHNAQNRSYWIPVKETPIFPSAYPQLTLTSNTELVEPTQRRFEFSLSGPDHMTIFVGLKCKARIINWSFNDTMIRDNWSPPHFIKFSYGKESAPFVFTIDIEKTKTSIDLSSLEIGVGGHWIHQALQRTCEFQTLVNMFPNYCTINDWVASYESWLF